ncbi:MAG: helix-turn-helix domain-containing protein [Candidatus Dormibacteria bacterium]
MRGGVPIRQARLRAGLSQRQLAQRLGTKQSVVARWEAGTTSPAFETVTAAVGACGFVLESRLVPADSSLERLLREQLRRRPADRVASVVNAARLRRV